MASFSDEHEDESEEVVVDVVLSSRHEMAPVMGAAAKNLHLNRLGAYVAELKSVYSSGSLLPCKDGSPPTPKTTKQPLTRLQTMETKKVVAPEEKKTTSITTAKKPRKRKPKSGGSSDFLFYISLVSIVGLSAVIVVRMVKAA